MRKYIISICLFLIGFISLSGQWYTRKYNVPDITILNNEQLTESLHDSKWNLIVSGGIVVAGGAVYLMAKYGDNSVGEDDTILDQILGEEGKKKTGMGLGIGMVAGGTIAGIVYLCRISRIRRVLQDKYPSAGSINIYPQLYVNNRSGTVSRGVMFTYNF